MTNASVISVTDLRKAYRLYAHPRDMLMEAVTGRRRHSEYVALDKINFGVEPGVVVGLIGRNGAGKSTLLRIIAGTLDPTSGTVSTRGRIAAILELGTGFHPDYTGRENVYLGGICLGLSRREIDYRFEDVVAFSELEDVIDQPFRTYSSGMQARLTFSVATCVDPDILIIDEALSVGDAKFQLKSFDKIRDFKRRGKSILLVSHSINHIVGICDSAILLERGRVYAEGDPNKVGQIYHELLFTPSRTEAVIISAESKNLAVLPKMEVSLTELIGGAGREPLKSPSELRPSPAGLDPGTNNPSLTFTDGAASIDEKKRDETITDASRDAHDQAINPSAESESNETPSAQVKLSMAPREHHYGNGAAAITQIQIIDKSGREVRDLQSLGYYTLSVNVLARDPLTNWCLGIHFRDHRGIELFGTDTFLFTGTTLPRLSAKAEATVQMHFRATLAAGTYYLTAGLAHEDGTKYDMWLDAYEFVVSPTVRLYHASLVDLEAVFEVADHVGPNATDVPSLN